MTEIAALPTHHPYRNNALDLLLSYKVELEGKQNTEPEEQALIMQLSPLLLERVAAAEERGELKGYKELVIRQLKKRFGDLSSELEIQVKNLSLLEAEKLGEALLDFTKVSDLLNWLQIKE